MEMTPVETTEISDEEMGLRFHMALDRLWKLLHPADREAVCCHGITYTQWGLLRTLCEGSPEAMPMGFLATALGLTPSGVTRCADPLVERGLIERRNWERFLGSISIGTFSVGRQGYGSECTSPPGLTQSSF